MNDRADTAMNYATWIRHGALALENELRWVVGAKAENHPVRDALFDLGVLCQEATVLGFQSRHQIAPVDGQRIGALVAQRIEFLLERSSDLRLHDAASASVSKVAFRGVRIDALLELAGVRARSADLELPRRACAAVYGAKLQPENDWSSAILRAACASRPRSTRVVAALLQQLGALHLLSSKARPVSEVFVQCGFSSGSIGELEDFVRAALHELAVDGDVLAVKTTVARLLLRHEKRVEAQLWCREILAELPQALDLSPHEASFASYEALNLLGQAGFRSMPVDEARRVLRAWLAAVESSPVVRSVGYEAAFMTEAKRVVPTAELDLALERLRRLGIRDSLSVFESLRKPLDRE